MTLDEPDHRRPIELDRRAAMTMLAAAGAALGLTGTVSAAPACGLLPGSDMRCASPVAVCFVRWWLNENSGLRQRIVIKSPDWLEFGFDVGGSALRVHLSENNLCVAAYDGEVWWDHLLDLDVYAERRGAGWICEDCEPEVRRVFATREDLWRDHLFDPLLAWINEELAPAGVLALFGSETGSTWARLVDNAGAAAGATKLIALRDGAPRIP